MRSMHKWGTREVAAKAISSTPSLNIRDGCLGKGLADFAKQAIANFLVQRRPRYLTQCLLVGDEHEIRGAPCMDPTIEVLR